MNLLFRIIIWTPCGVDWKERNYRKSWSIYLKFIIIGFILLLALDNSHGQDEEDLDNSVNNNPDDEENSDETIGKLLFDTWR